MPETKKINEATREFIGQNYASLTPKRIRAYQKKGADLDALWGDGSTLLQKLCRLDHNTLTSLKLSDSIQTLLECGAGPNVKDKKGQSAIHYAIASGSAVFDKLEWLQAFGADFIGLQNDKILASLHPSEAIMASIKERAEIQKQMLKELFDPKFWDHDVVVGYHENYYHGHRINISSLAQQHIELLREELGKNGIKFNQRIATAPSEHTKAGDSTIRIIEPESVRKLRRDFFHWDVNEKENLVEETASEYYKRQIAEQNKPPKKKEEKMTEKEATEELEKLVGYPKEYDKIRELIRAGAKVNAQNRFGQTFLYTLCSPSNKKDRKEQEAAQKLLVELLENGADPNLANRDDKSVPLIAAAISKDLEIVKILAEHHADFLGKVEDLLLMEDGKPKYDTLEALLLDKFKSDKKAIKFIQETIKKQKEARETENKENEMDDVDVKAKELTYEYVEKLTKLKLKLKAQKDKGEITEEDYEKQLKEFKNLNKPKLKADIKQAVKIGIQEEMPSVEKNVVASKNELKENKSKLEFTPSEDPKVEARSASEGDKKMTPNEALEKLKELYKVQRENKTDPTKEVKLDQVKDLVKFMDKSTVSQIIQNNGMYNEMLGDIAVNFGDEELLKLLDEKEFDWEKQAKEVRLSIAAAMSGKEASLSFLAQKGILDLNQDDGGDSEGKDKKTTRDYIKVRFEKGDEVLKNIESLTQESSEGEKKPEEKKSEPAPVPEPAEDEKKEATNRLRTIINSYTGEFLTPEKRTQLLSEVNNLIQKGADLNVVAPNDSTIAHFAAAHGDENLLNTLYEKKIDWNKIAFPNPTGQAGKYWKDTPTTLAVKAINKDALTFFAQKGFNFNEEDEYGQSALSNLNNDWFGHDETRGDEYYTEAQKIRNDVMKILMEREEGHTDETRVPKEEKAEVEEKKSEEKAETPPTPEPTKKQKEEATEELKTLITSWEKPEDVKLDEVKQLVKDGADPNAIVEVGIYEGDEKQSIPVAHVLAGVADYNLMEMLQEHNANWYDSSIPGNQNTAATMAGLSSNKESLKFFAENLPHIFDIKSSEGEKPLTYASDEVRKEIEEILAKKSEERTDETRVPKEEKAEANPEEKKPDSEKPIAESKPEEKKAEPAPIPEPTDDEERADGSEGIGGDDEERTDKDTEMGGSDDEERADGSEKIGEMDDETRADKDTEMGEMDGTDTSEEKHNEDDGKPIISPELLEKRLVKGKLEKALADSTEAFCDSIFNKSFSSAEEFANEFMFGLLTFPLDVIGNYIDPKKDPQLEELQAIKDALLRKTAEKDKKEAETPIKLDEQTKHLLVLRQAMEERDPEVFKKWREAMGPENMPKDLNDITPFKLQEYQRHIKETLEAHPDIKDRMANILKDFAEFPEGQFLIKGSFPKGYTGSYEDLIAFLSGHKVKAEKAEPTKEEDKPADEGKPAPDAGGKPADEGNPIDEGKPTPAPEGKPIDEEKTAPAPEGKPIDEGKPTPAPEGKPIDEEKPAPAPEGKPIDEEKPAPAPEGKPIDEEKPAPAPEGKPIDEGKPTPAPEGKPIDEEKPTPAPEGKPIDEGKPAPEKNTVPKSTPAPTPTSILGTDKKNDKAEELPFTLPKNMRRENKERIIDCYKKVLESGNGETTEKKAEEIAKFIEKVDSRTFPLKKALDLIQKREDLMTLDKKGRFNLSKLGTLNKTRDKDNQLDQNVVKMALGLRKRLAEGSKAGEPKSAKEKGTER